VKLRLGRGFRGAFASLGSYESGGVLDHIRCELIDKRSSGEAPVGFLLNLEENKRFYSSKETRARVNAGGRKRREHQGLRRRSV
jgi:hypothetical protein